jgi:hypothetical protein
MTESASSNDRDRAPRRAPKGKGLTGPRPVVMRKLKPVGSRPRLRSSEKARA